MKNLRRLILCLVFTLASWALSAQEKAADIFVMSTHAESSEWIKILLKPIRRMELEKPDWRFSSAFLHLTSHPDVASLQKDVDSVLTAQALRPRLAIIVGASCFSFVPDVEKQWPGIPMMLIGEQDYYCDKDYILGGPPDPDANRYPVSGFCTVVRIIAVIVVLYPVVRK